MPRIGTSFLSGLLTKLTALVCACGLWIYVDSTTMKTATLSVEPNIVHEDGRPAADLNGHVRTLRVTVRGRVDHVEHLLARDITCNATIPNEIAEEGFTVHFDDACVTMPTVSGVVLVQVVPAKVTLTRSAKAP